MSLTTRRLVLGGLAAGIAGPALAQSGSIDPSKPSVRITKTLYEELIEAKLDQFLSLLDVAYPGVSKGGGTYRTWFVPNADAWRPIPAMFFHAIGAPANRDLLTDFVDNHSMPASAPLGTPLWPVGKPQKFGINATATLRKDDQGFVMDLSDAMNGSVRVVRANVALRNAQVNVIDRVLIPGGLGHQLNQRRQQGLWTPPA